MKTKGWRKVFAFTFLQYIKTKSFIAGLIVSCVLSAVLCVLTNVLPAAIIKSNSDSSSSGGVGGDNVDPFLESGVVYLYDAAEILNDEDKNILKEMFDNRFVVSEKTLEDTVAELAESEDIEAAVQIMKHTNEDGSVAGYEVRSYYTSEAKSSVDTLNGIMWDLVNRRVLLNAGVSPDKYADTQVAIYTSKTEAGNKSLNSIQSMVNYAIPFVVSMLLFVLIFLYGQTVAQSIATEKTSRVMELLLTSVRPLAVVIGKVLAMGLVSFLQFFLIIAVGALSLAVSAPFGWLSQTAELLKNPEVQSALAQMGQPGGVMGATVAGVSTTELELAQTLNDITKVLTPVNIIAIVLIFLLGFLFFSLIAALIGASVSRMEDLQAAMSPYSLIGVFGFYLAYFPLIFNSEAILASGEMTTNSVQMFSNFFPISSPFALPSAVLLGTMEQWKIFVSIAILAASVVLIAMVVGKVYEAIILHNGNRIKFGDILKMAVRK